MLQLLKLKEILFYDLQILYNQLSSGFFFLQQDLDVDPKETNKGTPEETGSYLVSKDLPKHCLYTRLSALQKLRVSICYSLQVCSEVDIVYVALQFFWVSCVLLV